MTLGCMVLAASCVGTTGSDLVTFPAYVAGPADADPTAPLAFTNGRGWEVSLDKATLHVGGVYLNRARPVSGGQETSCILPAQYVAQVSGGMTVDVLSPRPQRVPVLGEGTKTRAVAGEVWLTGGDVGAEDDATTIVDVHGFVARGGVSREVRGTLSIGKNRAIPVRDPSQPGADPICKQRIVSPVAIDVTPENGGALVVRIDPRTWFANVDFDALEPDPDGVLRFVDATEEQPNVSLYEGVRAHGDGVRFEWLAADPGPGMAVPAQHAAGPLPTGGAAPSPLACPVAAASSFAPASLAPFSPPADPGPGGVLFDVSGEVLGSGGYAFPPTGGDVAFVDGWEVRFSRILVTVDHLTLSENPDLDPGDPSRVGATIARVDGPWAVDLHRAGDLPGKGGGGETAIGLASLGGKNLDGGGAFDPARRYAFGFDAVAATAGARNVNLDDAALVDYAEMIASGYTVLYVGTATFKGEGCAPADPEFDRLPKVVNLRLGFRSPTGYQNCQNPDDDPAKPFPGEEHQRGIAVKDNASVIAQVTLHTDHPFWESVAHDAPPHFDPIAAQYTCAPPGTTPTARVEDMVGVDVLGFRDRDGHALPWRSCLGAAFVPPGGGTMHFDPRGVPVDPASSDGSRLRDFADYMTYVQSTQGHLASDGLCVVARHYPSPR